METLVEMAKRLGIKPNPRITDEEYLKIKEQMLHELEKIGRPLTVNSDLYSSLYNIRKCAGLAEQYNSTGWTISMQALKQEHLPGISAYPAGGFYYHRSSKKEDVERFVADLKLDSPNMPEIFKKLDEFVLKHEGTYKVILFKKDWKSKLFPNDSNRTDVLNLYLPKPITPQIAKEFYEIVKPVLEERTHDFLDGFPILQKGQEIKGIKFGPEPQKNWEREDFRAGKERIRAVFSGKMAEELSDFHYSTESLGSMSAMEQFGDFLYYLIGREGQNPIQLGNQFGDPKKKYTKKSIDIDPPTGIRKIFSFLKIPQK